jgi:ABC-type multidrug transport system fused ATPase/permease subunit
VIDQQPDIRDKPDAHPLERARGSVVFEQVHFSYGRREILHGIDFVVKPGQVVAIVGPTGAGKTTIANLTARFYDPQSGRVKFDGYDLRDLTIRTLRDNIAMVTQEPILFSGTIRDNIAYGRPQSDMQAVIAAAMAANAHEFIAALPSGYFSQIGERGVRLSGGERQRLTIARAFLTNAPLLILDEPTASVDARTEQVILDALDNLIVNRTTFIIAHRLSTIRRSDQILVVDHGHIIERGTHEELLARAGLYAEMYHIQMGGLRRKVKQPG